MAEFKKVVVKVKSFCTGWMIDGAEEKVELDIRRTG